MRREIETKRNDLQIKSGLSKEDYFRKLHIQYIPIEGHFGNIEHSYIILNIPFVDARYLADKFGQQSFFFANVFENEVSEVSYYERKHIEDDFKLIETTREINDAKDLDDFFSKYGDIKWSFYLKYFNENYVEREIGNKTFFDESFDETLTIFGRASRRRWCDKSFSKKYIDK